MWVYLTFCFSSPFYFGISCFTCDHSVAHDEKAYSDGEINPITRSSNNSNIVGNYNRSRSRSPPLYKKHDRHDVGASRRDEGNSSRTRYGNANNRSHYGGKGGDRDNTSHYMALDRSAAMIVVVMMSEK